MDINHNPGDKINDHNEDVLDLFRDIAKNNGQVPLSVFLYDQDGHPYWIPLDQLQTIVDLKNDKEGNDIMKKYIQHLSEKRKITIIQSAIFQQVKYKDNVSKNEIDGLMHVREGDDATHVRIYKLILNRSKKLIIPKKPAQSQVFDRNKEPFESMFTNLI